MISSQRDVGPSTPHQRFFFNLGALAAAVLLIVSAAAFGPRAVTGIGLGIGIAGCATSLIFIGALVHRRRLDGDPGLRLFGRVLGLWSILAGAMATVAIWEIIGATAFDPAVGRWLTLANGLVIAALACAGLVAHEVCTERVEHVIEVVERPPRGLA
jgi:peptidoglycan biosynthesis protein MviN/MurJ (putative lipid II flippase)